MKYLFWAFVVLLFLVGADCFPSKMIKIDSSNLILNVRNDTISYKKDTNLDLTLTLENNYERQLKIPLNEKSFYIYRITEWFGNNLCFYNLECQCSKILNIAPHSEESITLKFAEFPDVIIGEEDKYYVLLNVGLIMPEKNERFKYTVRSGNKFTIKRVD